MKRLNLLEVMPKTLAVLIAASTLFAGTACSKDESTIKVEDFKKPGQEPGPDGAEPPKKKANLPSAPPASAFVIPEKNTDGTLRVRGLIHNQEKYLDQNQDVVLTGVISYISPQCDPRKAKTEGLTCLKPNLFIKDDVDAVKALQVVGFPFEFVKRAKLEPGQSHVFRGKYVKKAFGFINSGDGLIRLTSVDDNEVIPSKK